MDNILGLREVPTAGVTAGMGTAMRLGFDEVGLLQRRLGSPAGLFIDTAFLKSTIRAASHKRDAFEWSSVQRWHETPGEASSRTRAVTGPARSVT
jgi:hypothetical protein